MIESVSRGTMVKTLLLLCIVIYSAPVDADLQSYSKSFTANKWDMLSLPGVPFPILPLDNTLPTPSAMLSRTSSYLYLWRWDTASQNNVEYPSSNGITFGNFLLTDGCLIYPISTSVTLSYSGVDDNGSLQMCIDLPFAGWTMVGNPYPYDVKWDDLKVTNGCVTLSIADAVTAGWISYPAETKIDGITKTIGTTEHATTQPIPIVNLDHLPEWKAMWVISNVDNLALILTPTVQ